MCKFLTLSIKNEKLVDLTLFKKYSNLTKRIKRKEKVEEEYQLH